jgi:hypothetical protein
MKMSMKNLIEWFQYAIKPFLCELLNVSKF